MMSWYNITISRFIKSLKLLFKLYLWLCLDLVLYSIKLRKVFLIKNFVSKTHSTLKKIVLSVTSLNVPYVRYCFYQPKDIIYLNKAIRLLIM